ncbi:putative trans-2-enoyl-CoA reductase 1, mitochondrial [Candida viswanathii]|uniref:enoyl-[acyl-carrier-protein] reductase n=1 Tax=Candida viswanathii TaxID=5486 RepID=A0A367YD27_9ASCO|nr:putative trans-2-enoyl-CoA reductase 1, mitochondrial [Candida viswanathii]
MSITGKAATYVTPWDSDLNKILLDATFDIVEADLQTNDIVLKTLATPINPSDIAQLLGGYNKPIANLRLGTEESHPVHVGGNEGVFEVIRVGEEITNYQVGDVVIPKLPGFGTWRTYAIVNVTETDPTPLIKVNGLAVDQAAVVSINPSTAYQLLHQFINDWAPGDWIVQNAGNSQASKYLTQLARNEGVKVLSVIRDNKPQDLIDELVEFGAAKVVPESEFLDVGFKIEEVTGGGNVRLALNSLGGPTVLGLVRSLSQDGTLVTYGVLAGGAIEYDGKLQLFKNLSTKAYWLTANTKKDPQRKVETVEALTKLFNDGSIKVVPYNKVKYDASVPDYTKLVLETIAKSKSEKQVIIYE